MSKALILSDRPLLTRKEEKVLAEANVQVTALSKFQEDMLKKELESFDVIVIDDSLRGGDVDEICRQLRLASKAFIMYTGRTPSWEMWEKTKEIGFDCYYKKPLSAQEMATKIKLAAYEMEYRARHAAPEKSSQAILPETKEPEPVKIEKIMPETMPVPVKPADTARNSVPEPPTAPDNSSNIRHDPKVVRLISGFLSGKIKQIYPEIDLCLGDGFCYREADGVLGTAGRETALILESLAKEGLLLKQDYEKMLLSPAGSMQLIPVERCPRCDSSDLSRGQLVEHFGCGHIGLESEFMKGPNQVCPKCKRQLKLIGTDYRKPGMRYVCNSCHGVFPSPTIKCRCLKTGEVYRLEELRNVPLYSYRLNEARKQRLEFELEPKRQLVDCRISPNPSR
jgi:DNA-binding NarL/FixJ family response regulator